MPSAWGLPGRGGCAVPGEVFIHRSHCPPLGQLIELISDAVLTNKHSRVSIT